MRMRFHETPFYYIPQGHKLPDGVIERRALYVNGEWVAPQGAGFYDVVNPSTEAVIGHVAEAAPADVERAVAAARLAFDKGPWPRMTIKERYQRMRRFLEALEKRRGEAAGLAIVEAGAPAPIANGMHVALTLDHMAGALEAALRLRPRALEPTITQMPDFFGGARVLGQYLAVYEPVGVASLFSAYNFPFLLNGVKIAPALIAGNTAVVKAPPQTPLETYIFAEAAEEADLPPGVLNVVSGLDVEIGKILSSDPRVDLVSFTGSDVVGAKIMAQAAPTVKRVFLELGGKSALIVRPDGDLDTAAAVGLSAMTNQAGQGCILTTRHLVHASVFDAYIEKITAMAGQVVIGDAANPATTMGPLISALQRDRSERFVNEAVAEGAEIVFGGKRPAHLDRGWFYEPTLVKGVQNSWPIAQQEIFGPVSVVMPFKDDEEAVEIANASDFGLSGHIISRDIGHAAELALQLRTGEVYINGGSSAMSPFQPFGGTRKSGFGKQGGDEGLLEYMNLKTILLKGG